MSRASKPQHVQLNSMIAQEIPDFDVAEFERKLVVRTMLIDDSDALVKLQGLCFQEMKPWSRDQVESQLQHFPDLYSFAAISGCCSQHGETAVL